MDLNKLTTEQINGYSAAEGVKGYYPAFDITPPQLITGVVTDLGIYSPYELKKYLEVSELGPYEMVV